jgi:shikimate kinase
MPVRESSFSAMGESAPELDLVLREPVVLIGMMGAGKTAVGRALSARLGVPMQDSDAEIVASAQLTIAEIFERYGEAFFRDKETQGDRPAAERGAPRVLSTGGGAWMAERNRALLTDRAAVLWLEADLELCGPGCATRRRARSCAPTIRAHAGEILTERGRSTGSRRSSVRVEAGLVDHADGRAGAGAPDRGRRGGGGGHEHDAAP